MVEAATAAGAVVRQAVAAPDAAVLQAAAKEAERAELQKIVDEHIRQIERMTPPPANKASILESLRAARGGNIASLAQAIINLRAELPGAIAESEQDAAINSYIAAQYDLNEYEMRRVKALSQRIDTNDIRSIRHFTDAFVDPMLPKEMQEEQSALHAKAIQLDPSIVENLNKATPQARAEVMAAYIAAQRDFKEVTKDPRYAAIKDQLERADRLGLEAVPEVQEWLRLAKDGKIDPKELGDKLDTRSTQQIDVYRKEMNQARGILSQETQTILNDTFGPPDQKGSNKAIVELALATFPKLKDPNYRMSAEEKAAVQAFALTRDTVITRMLGDEALSKGRSLERETGTLEERTQAAYQLIQQNMPPELANMPERILKARIKETLEELDKNNISVQNADMLSAQQLATLSTNVTNDMIGAREKERFLEANAAPAGGGETPMTPEQTVAFLADFEKKKAALAAAEAAKGGAAPNALAANTATEQGVAPASAQVAAAVVAPPPGMDAAVLAAAQAACGGLCASGVTGNGPPYISGVPPEGIPAVATGTKPPVADISIKAF